MSQFTAFFNAPYSLLKITCDQTHVLELRFVERKSESANPSELTECVVAQLAAFHQDPQFKFTLPLNAVGTSYQQKIWETLRQIPVGQVWRYSDISRQLQSSARAVGGACRRNPIPVIVPCHRVVAASGLGGFSGKTSGAMMDVKRWLLTHEGVM